MPTQSFYTDDRDSGRVVKLGTDISYQHVYDLYMYAYSLRFNRQLILCVAVRQKLGGKHAASGESRRPRQQACARSIREKRSSLVSRELFSLHSGAARTAVRQACPSGHRCRCGGGRVAVPTPASTCTEDEIKAPSLSILPRTVCTAVRGNSDAVSRPKAGLMPYAVSR